MVPDLSPLPSSSSVPLSIQAHIVVAQKFEDTLGDDFAKTWNNFIDSGQVWALIIGLGIGWLFGKLLNF